VDCAVLVDETLGLLQGEQGKVVLPADLDGRLLEKACGRRVDEEIAALQVLHVRNVYQAVKEAGQGLLAAGSGIGQTRVRMVRLPGEGHEFAQAKPAARLGNDRLCPLPVRA